MKNRRDERGATLLSLPSVRLFSDGYVRRLEFGRALWTQTPCRTRNAVTRYAVNHPASDTAAVQNVVVYGDPAGGSKTLVNNLTTANVQVQYSSFGLGEGTVSVSITNYKFQFIIPIVGTTISMPNYTTTLTGENAGLVPPNL